ncbi:hypothetical protein VTK56DRAFT_7862 [Thermocarpiscus australiensis]
MLIPRSVDAGLGDYHSKEKQHKPSRVARPGHAHVRSSPWSTIPAIPPARSVLASHAHVLVTRYAVKFSRPPPNSRRRLRCRTESPRSASLVFRQQLVFLSLAAPCPSHSSCGSPLSNIGSPDRQLVLKLPAGTVAVALLTQPFIPPLWHDENLPSRWLSQTNTKTSDNSQERREGHSNSW